MKTLIIAVVLALVPSFAFATNHCNQFVRVVEQVVAHPVVTFVHPVRQVQFVEVRDNHHQNNVQRVVVRAQNNHHAQNIVVVEKVKVQRQQNHHHNNQQRQRGFFQRILGR